MCQKEVSSRRCLSTGECRRCKFVEMSLARAAVNKYEGCEITSTTPICDANSATPDVIEYAMSDYTDGNVSVPIPEAGVAHLLIPDCVKCKQSGKFVISYATE